MNELKPRGKIHEKYVGNKFGKLLVIGVHSRDTKSRRLIWQCLCDCGNICTAFSRNLERNAEIDCGCSKSQKMLNIGMRLRKPELPQIINRILDTYKRNAQNKGNIFSLTYEQFRELIASDCHYCGVEPSNMKKLREVVLHWNGIDRKDNDKGYTVENCVPCCKDCNYLKNNRDYMEFLSKIATIHKLRGT